MAEVERAKVRALAFIAGAAVASAVLTFIAVVVYVATTVAALGTAPGSTLREAVALSFLAGFFLLCLFLIVFMRTKEGVEKELERGSG